MLISEIVVAILAYGGGAVFLMITAIYTYSKGNKNKFPATQCYSQIPEYDSAYEIELQNLNRTLRKSINPESISKEHQLAQQINRINAYKTNSEIRKQKVTRYIILNEQNQSSLFKQVANG